MPDRMPSPSSPQDESTPQSSPQASPQSASQVSPQSARDGGTDREGGDNPFAPPPEGTPEQPWRPRQPENGGDGEGRNGSGPGWSDRQPGRSSGGFGQRPGGSEGGSGGSGGPMGPMRWDPTDPVQRKARYALLAGMWGFFFGLFGWPYLALPLGAFAVYWALTSLRGKARTPDPTQAAAARPDAAAKPQRTAAMGGLVAGGLALALVGLTFLAQLVYRDYYVCERDANTHAAQQQCEELLPGPLRSVLGDQD